MQNAPRKEAQLLLRKRKATKKISPAHYYQPAGVLLEFIRIQRYERGAACLSESKNVVLMNSRYMGEGGEPVLMTFPNNDGTGGLKQ